MFLTGVIKKIYNKNMRQTELFSKTLREKPKDEDAKNAELLIRGGYIDKLMSGVYTYLPLGLKVLRKIENIIREEMDSIGGQEILMPAMHPRENWESTGRWESMADVLFKFKGAGDKDFTLGPTHEEVVTPLTKKFIFSYKDLPFAVYQIQSKFRNEPRSKSGLLRGREFVMKDLYSFHTDEEDLNKYYKEAEKAYERIWQRLGLGEITLKTFASGGTFSKYSHEYQTISQAGEDKIYVCSKCKVAVNHEIIDEQKECPECGNGSLEEKNAIEVGNIFALKTKYSQAFGLNYTDEKGEEKPVYMGCYGIGPSRVMGTIVEVMHDKGGLIWPENVAPYKIHLLNFNDDASFADEIYEKLEKAGHSVLYDDRQESPGVKLKDADLLGVPHRVVVSPKTGDKIEYKKRIEDKEELIAFEELIKKTN